MSVTVTGDGPNIALTGSGSSFTITVTTGGGGGGGAVDSVNGETGTVVLTASDVGAAATSHTHAASAITSGTIDDARIPSTITRDTEVPTLAGAVEVSVVTGVGPLLMASTAVDGSATTVTIIVPSPGTPASGSIPADYEASDPLLTNVPIAAADAVTPDGAILCVPSGTGVGLYRWNTGQMDEPWEEVPCPVGRMAYYEIPSVAQWYAVRRDTEFLTPQARHITYSTASGLDAGLFELDDVIGNHEGILDTERWVCAYFDTTVVNPTSYATAPVTQPTPDGGVIVEGADVLVLTAADSTKNGLWHIDIDDGTWSQLNYPGILIGNSFCVMVNAEGDAADGTHFEWMDDDPKIRQRRSFAQPGSSNGFADGRNGRWIKYAPAGNGTVDVVSNVAQDRILGRVSSGSGDSEELTAAQVRTLLGNPVVGGQDEGPVVTATSATTMLDAVIPLTGAAGDLFRISMGGRYLNNSGTTKSPTITVKLGATTVGTLTPISAIASNASDRYWRGTTEIRVNAATDHNAISDGQIHTSIFTVTAGTASGDITAGINLDIQGAVQSGGSQEIQLTQVVVERIRA